MPNQLRPSPACTADLTVVELTGSVAGAYAAKLLATQGASVFKEPRSTAAVSSRELALELYLDAGKSPTPASAGALAELIAGADVLVRSSAPDPLAPLADELAEATNGPGLIRLEITPFGSTGPWADHRSTDFTDQASSGHLLLTGDPDREPLRGPEHQVAHAAGLHGAIGTVAAVTARNTTGRGQRVEVNHHQVMTALHQFTLLRYTHNGDVLNRMGNRYAGPGHPIGAYRCGSGMISLVVPRDDQLERLLGVAGLDHLLDHPDIESTYDLMHHPTLLDEHLVPWLAAQELEEIVELLQAIRVPAGPVSSMQDVLHDEHLAQRRYWRTETHGERSLTLPGPPFRITETGPVDPSSRPVTAEPEGDLTDGPLTGLRVLDLTRVWAGPLATRILADLGADVIMVEAPWARGPAGIDRSSVLATHYYPGDDPGERHWNRIGFVNKYGLNKRSVALDLGDALAKQALEALISRVDVVIENYSPRVMPQLGLDEDRLHQLNPSLIYVTMPGFGRTGPARNRVAYGPMIDSHAGLSVLQGYPDEPARKGGVAWPDPIAGMHAAFGTLVGVLATARDHRGRTIEVPQLEATVATVGHALVERQLTDAEPMRLGNRHPFHGPQGVYRCAGHDRWLAMTVVDDTSWSGLCSEAGLSPAWASWGRRQRRSAHDQIDRALEVWAADKEATELMHRLQAVGVPAMAVADAPMVLADPQLAAQQFFVTIDHPEAGSHPWPGLAIQFDEFPATYRRPAPLLNQHGSEVLRDVAGLDPAVIEDLRARGVMTDTPPD